MACEQPLRQPVSVGRVWTSESNHLATNPGSAFTFCDLKWLLNFSEPVFSSEKARTMFYGTGRIKRRNTQRFSISFILNTVYNHFFRNLNTHFSKSIRTNLLTVTDFFERWKQRFWFYHFPSQIIDLLSFFSSCQKDGVFSLLQLITLREKFQDNLRKEKNLKTEGYLLLLH